MIDVVEPVEDEKSPLVGEFDTSGEEVVEVAELADDEKGFEVEESSRDISPTIIIRWFF